MMTSMIFGSDMSAKVNGRAYIVLCFSLSFNSESNKSGIIQGLLISCLCRHGNYLMAIQILNTVKPHHLVAHLTSYCIYMLRQLEKTSYSKTATVLCPRLLGTCHVNYHMATLVFCLKTSHANIFFLPNLYTGNYWVSQSLFLDQICGIS